MTKVTINGKPSVFVHVLPPKRTQRAGQNRTQQWASVAVEMAEESPRLRRDTLAVSTEPRTPTSWGREIES